MKSTSKRTISLYRGKNLEDMTKPELVEAIIEMGQMAELQSKQHLHDLGVLSGNSQT